MQAQGVCAVACAVGWVGWRWRGGRGEGWTLEWGKEGPGQTNNYCLPALQGRGTGIDLGAGRERLGQPGMLCLPALR